jgi:hypothetical protein
MGLGDPCPSCGDALLVAASTMIGALTMSRIVTDPELSAKILKEAEKSLGG